MATKAKKAGAIAEPTAQAAAPARVERRNLKVKLIGGAATEPAVDTDDQAEPVGGALPDNLFEVFGVPGADEAYLKSLLSELIDDQLDEQDLTQTAAAEKMGMTQPDVSAILRGRFKNYSVFRLLKALASLGYDIEIRPVAREGRTPGGVRIVA